MLNIEEIAAQINKLDVLTGSIKVTKDILDIAGEDMTATSDSKTVAECQLIMSRTATFYQVCFERLNKESEELGGILQRLYALINNTEAE